MLSPIEKSIHQNAIVLHYSFHRSERRALAAFYLHPRG